MSSADRDPLDPHLSAARLLELQGSDDATPTDDEAEHLLACDRCTARLEGTSPSRPDLLDVALHDLREAAPRFDLEAGRARLLAAASHRKESFFSPYRVSASVGFLAIAAAAMFLLWRQAPPPRGVAESGHAEVTLSPDAHVVTTQAGPDEILTLEGEAKLSVVKIPAGERFRLRAGDDELEVHGTRFLVAGSGAGLTRVAVEEGVVEVRPSCCRTVFLHAGESWDRSTAALSPPLPAAPPTEPAPAEAALPGDSPTPARAGSESAAPPVVAATGTNAGLPATGPTNVSGAQLLADGTRAYDGGRYAVAAGLLDRAVAAEPKASWAPDARTLAGTARVLAASPSTVPSMGVSVRSFDNAAARAGQLGKSALAAAARLGAARHLSGKAANARYCALRTEPALSAEGRREAAAKCQP
jgi:hypothetical protein